MIRCLTVGLYYTFCFAAVIMAVVVAAVIMAVVVVVVTIPVVIQSPRIALLHFLHHLLIMDVVVIMTLFNQEAFLQAVPALVAVKRIKVTSKFTGNVKNDVSQTKQEVFLTLTLEHVNRNEIFRYLGYHGQAPDSIVQQLVEEILGELQDIVSPKYLSKTFSCEITQSQITLFSEDNQNHFPSLTISSKNLADNLRNCHQVILFAATLGLGADKLLQKYEITNMAKATISQACSAAYIEAYCNVLQENIRIEYMEKGIYLRPRFSPGYGDLPLEMQKNIFEILECAKRLGLTLTESLLMYPTKSVTAFIGLTKDCTTCSNPAQDSAGKCSQCKNTGCEYRNED